MLVEKAWKVAKMPRLSATVAAAIAMFVSMLAVAPAQGAELELESFSTSVVAEDGSDEARAGAHPAAASAEMHFETVPRPWAGEPNRRGPAEAPRDVEVRLPAGFVGNPQAAGRCTLNEIKIGSFATDRSPCPLTAAVGHMVVEGAVSLWQPIFNIVPEEGYPAEFAFTYQGFTYVLYPELRSDGDYGINVVSPNSPDDMIRGIRAELCSWGVVETSEPSSGEPSYECRKRADAPSGTKPFLTMQSTECPAEAPVTTLRVNSWPNPDRYIESQFAAPPITDCDTLEFEPSVSIAPTASTPDSPTGLGVSMTFPQEDNDQGQAPPALKKAVVTLPEGMSINPSSANGLGACADNQLNLKSKAPVTCPPNSKLGTVTATSPLLEKPIPGAVYIRTQNSADPESGEMYRLGLVLEDKQRGISVRLPGQVRADKNTGQLVTTFDNNPELPVSKIQLELKEGPRAPLATPASCGTKNVDTALSSWGGQTVNRGSQFHVDCTAGLGRFNPAFLAGTANPLAGTHSAFSMRITRPDGNQALDRITVAMPAGFAATLRGVATCAEGSVAAAEAPSRSGAEELASPSCPANSQVGTTTIGAGVGPNPFYVKTGKAYLTGPYKGAPLSLAFIVPAVAGPFDLGVQVVRTALRVNPTTAQITAVSDPIPQILKGVPLKIRDIRVDVDRPDFSLNPTNCQEMAVSGQIGGGAGALANVDNRFQVGGCSDLGFKPRLKLQLKGKTKRGGNPALRAVLTQPAGQANIASTTVVLPKSAFIDNEHINNPCTREQFAQNACPAASILGNATAWSPLLDEPLTGPVYFRANGGARELPDIVAALHGQVDIELVGFIDSVVNKKTNTSRVRNTFAVVPDAPVSRFVLNMKGGKLGLIENSRNLCRQKNLANVQMAAHNGRISQTEPVIAVDCGKKAKRSK